MRLVLGLFLLFTLPAAFAAPLTWTLTDVAFHDGSTLSGSFVYDADTNVYSSIDILMEGADFRIETPYSTSTRLNATDYGSDIHDLNFYFATALTNGGGSVDLVVSSSASSADSETDSFYYYQYAHSGSEWEPINYFTKYMSAGSVVATPIPAAAWLLGSALAGLGWMRRKST